MLQPIATYCNLLQPLRSYRLLLHRLQNLLADVEPDLHGERDHESVADLRPASPAGKAAKTPAYG